MPFPVIRYLPTTCTHNPAYNFWGFPVTSDLLSFFPISPTPSPFRRKGSPRVGRRGDGRCPVKAELGSRRKGIRIQPMEARGAEWSQGRMESDVAAGDALGPGDQGGNTGQTGWLSWGNGGRTEGSEARGLWKKNFGGIGCPLPKDEKSPRPPRQLAG